MAELSVRAQCVPGNALALPYPLDRKAISDQIETLIGLLDAMDGDFDLEPEEDYCVAGDDGCAPLILNGRTHWGSPDEAAVIVARYGIDQSLGPVNAEEADAYSRRLDDERSEQEYRAFLARRGRAA